MSPPTLRRLALAATILLAPSLITGVVVARRSSPRPATSAPAPSAPAPSAVEALSVTATMVPYQSVVFLQPPDPSAMPPAKTCQSAMSAMQSQGGWPAFVGRLEVTIQATRTVQLRVDKLTIQTVRREAADLAAVATCALPETPNAAPGEDTFDETFPFASGSYFIPVVTLADQHASTAPPIAVPFPGPGPINETTFDFRAGTTLMIPVYVMLTSGPTFRSGFRVAVDLTVNGRAHHQTLTNAGDLFWLYESSFRLGDGPVHQWNPTTKSWQTL